MVKLPSTAPINGNGAIKLDCILVEGVRYNLGDNRSNMLVGESEKRRIVPKSKKHIREIGMFVQRGWCGKPGVVELEWQHGANDIL